MYALLRRLTLAILGSEFAEREAHAHKLAQEAYLPGSGGKKGRAWWAGYEAALRAIRESRRAL